MLPVTLILPALNLYDLYKSITHKVELGKYRNFGNPGHADLNSSKTIVLLKNNIPRKSICYLWENPREYDEIITECAVAEINYLLYPVTVKFGSVNFKGPYNYILCDSDKLEELNLYLTFFDMDKEFVAIANDKQTVILKRRKSSTTYQH